MSITLAIRKYNTPQSIAETTNCYELIIGLEMLVALLSEVLAYL